MLTQASDKGRSKCNTLQCIAATRRETKAHQAKSRDVRGMGEGNNRLAGQTEETESQYTNVSAQDTNRADQADRGGKKAKATQKALLSTKVSLEHG